MFFFFFLLFFSLQTRRPETPSQVIKDILLTIPVSEVTPGKGNCPLFPPFQ